MVAAEIILVNSYYLKIVHEITYWIPSMGNDNWFNSNKIDFMVTTMYPRYVHEHQASALKINLPALPASEDIILIFLRQIDGEHVAKTVIMLETFI